MIDLTYWMQLLLMSIRLVLIASEWIETEKSEVTRIWMHRMMIFECDWFWSTSSDFFRSGSDSTKAIVRSCHNSWVCCIWVGISLIIMEIVQVVVAQNKLRRKPRLSILSAVLHCIIVIWCMSYFDWIYVFIYIFSTYCLTIESWRYLRNNA